MQLLLIGEYYALCWMQYEEQQLWGLIHPEVQELLDECASSASTLQAQRRPPDTQELMATVPHQTMMQAEDGCVLRSCLTWLLHNQYLRPLLLPDVSYLGGSFTAVHVASLGGHNVFAPGAAADFVLGVDDVGSRRLQSLTVQGVVDLVAAQCPWHHGWVQTGEAVCVDKEAYELYQNYMHGQQAAQGDVQVATAVSHWQCHPSHCTAAQVPDADIRPHRRPPRWDGDCAGGFHPR